MSYATSVSAGLLLSAALCAASPTACAQESADPGQAQVDGAGKAQWDLYLSGYAFHNRHTYSEKRLRKLNEKAWGGGFGKTRRTERGNDESLYLMAIRDSNRNPQWMAGYAYQWMFSPKSTPLEGGLGLTAAVIRRKDWFDGKPFPAVLPVASVGTQHTKLMLTYVPHIPRGKGQGNILLFQLKFAF